MRVVGSHKAVSPSGPWSRPHETGSSQEGHKHRALCSPPPGPRLALVKGSSTLWWVNKGSLPRDTKEVNLEMASGH